MNSLWIKGKEYEVPSVYAELSPELQVRVAVIAAQGMSPENAALVLYLIMPRGMRTWWHLVAKPALAVVFRYVLPFKWAEDLYHATALAAPFFDLKADFPCAPGGLARPNVPIHAIRYSEFEALQNAARELADERNTWNRAKLAAILFRLPAAKPDQYGDARQPFDEYSLDDQTAKAEQWPEFYWVWAEQWFYDQMKQITDDYSMVFSKKSESSHQPSSSFELIHAIAGTSLKYEETQQLPCSYIFTDLQLKLEQAEKLKQK